MHLIFGVAIAALLFLLLRQWGRMDVAESAKGAFWGVVLLLGVVCTPAGGDRSAAYSWCHLRGPGALFTVGGGPSSSGCCGGVFAMGARCRRWWQ